VESRPVLCGALLAITLVLQLGAVAFDSRGAVSFASTGLLALGFIAGPAAAMVAGALAAATQLVSSRGLLHRAVFDAANLALAAAAGAGFYRLIDGEDLSPGPRVAAAAVAGFLFFAVNSGLL